MAENLKTTHYNNGDEISGGGEGWDYDNNPTHSETYGRLYNWHTVDDDRGVCPDGWHVPSDVEYTVLTDYLGGDGTDAPTGGKMKEAGYEHWNSPNTGATNESGFTGLPGGYRNIGSGSYDDMGEMVSFWSSSEYGSSTAWQRRLYHNYSGAWRWYFDKQFGFSIRCLADEITTGCTDPEASNYDETATVDDGSCCIELWDVCYNIEETTEINLSENGLTGDIPHEIGNLTNLTYLNLVDNQLTTLPESIGDLSSLEFLYLSVNQLTTLPESIGDLSSLEELRLYSNQLTTLPESIGNFSSLTYLYLGYNQLTTLPESICNLSSDCDIHVSDNQLCEEYHFDCIDDWYPQICSGCTGESSCNYNPDATVDDGSCEFTSCDGTLLVPEEYSTIQSAIDAASDGDEVLVSAGTYYENINYNCKDIAIIGEDRETTIIDGNTRVVRIEGYDCSFSSEASILLLSGFTIKGGNSGGMSVYNASPTLNNLIVKNNYISTDGFGGGIAFIYSNSTMSNVIIDDNSSSEDGGGIFIYSSNLIFTDILITNNYCASCAAGIMLYASSNLTLINGTVTGNSSGIHHQENGWDNGNGIKIFGNGNSLTLVNSIVWNNSASGQPNITGTSEDEGDYFVTYSNIEGGWEGEGNIDADPLFTDPDNGDYTLQASSPCIDAGDPNSELDPDGTVADMGAYYFHQDVYGCTNPYACNYDDTANVYDGSCEYEFDCAGTCGGELEIDCGGVCGGDNSTALSCCGLPFYDDCTSDCYEDYNTGECCLISEVDECGVCYGDGIADGECDCAGNVDLGCGCNPDIPLECINGAWACDIGCSYALPCGWDYDGDGEVDSGTCMCDIDCAGTCGGELEWDCAGICGGDNSSYDGCCGLPPNDDCTDDCYIDSLGACCIDEDTDECGLCFGDGSTCCEDGDTNNDNPCNPWECWNDVWYEIIIDCAEQEGVPCEGGIYVSPEEGECCSICVLSGDINVDGQINVLDIVVVVEIILTGDGYDAVGDVNEDGMLNVLDIVMLVDWVLNGMPEMDSDGDGVIDEDDSDPNNPYQCSDLDGDTCDDCSTGTFNPTDDGYDYDGDGQCDDGDCDDDNDGCQECWDYCP